MAKDLLGFEIALGDFVVHKPGGHHSYITVGVVTKIGVANIAINGGRANQSADNCVIVSGQMQGDERYDSLLQKHQAIIEESRQEALNPPKSATPSYMIKVAIDSNLDQVELRVLALSGRNSVAVEGIDSKILTNFDRNARFWLIGSGQPNKIFKTRNRPGTQPCNTYYRYAGCFTSQYLNASKRFSSRRLVDHCELPVPELEQPHKAVIMSTQEFSDWCYNKRIYGSTNRSGGKLPDDFPTKAAMEINEDDVPERYI